LLPDRLAVAAGTSVGSAGASFRIYALRVS